MENKNYVIFDIETRTPFDYTKKFSTDDLEVSVVVAYRSDTQEFSSYWEDDLKKLEDLFQEADVIVGYNSWGFDEPVLQKYMELDLSTLGSIDMLEAVRKAIGTRIKLDILAQATLGESKTAKGIDAVKFWQQGMLKELEEYCRQDVNVTQKLFFKGLTDGKLSYFDGLGQEVQFDVDWNDGLRETKAEAPQQSLF